MGAWIILESKCLPTDKKETWVFVQVLREFVTERSKAMGNFPSELPSDPLFLQ